MSFRILVFFPVLWGSVCLGAPPQASYQTAIEPFVTKYCVSCHNAKSNVADLDMQKFHSSADVLQHREQWERIIQRVKTGEMPPRRAPKPPDEAVKNFSGWVEDLFDEADKNAKPDPGRVTARRLNRYEYNNTIRDLVGVKFRPADDFPADDSGYGFDNIGDVLSLSPALMEKYLNAAERVARMAIITEPPPKPTSERFTAPRPPNHQPVTEPNVLRATYNFPVDGDYEIQTNINLNKLLKPTNYVRYGVWLDGVQVHVFDAKPNNPGDVPKRTFTVKLHVPAGEHQLRATMLSIDLKADTVPEELTEEFKAKQKGFQAKMPDIAPFVDTLEVLGPYNPGPWPVSEAQKRIFVCGEKTPECARMIVTAFARKAFRRPPAPAEVDKFVRFVDFAQKNGDSFEQGVQVAIQAILVSPNFLFRVEHDRTPGDPSQAHPVDDFELATRLSYFLWSSMPDEQLLRAAEQKTLRRPGVLEAQIARMIKDPKAAALSENFAGQWLQLRNLDSVRPDPDKFPAFTPELRAAMRTETRMFFDSILHEDRSILDFIDGKYTFLNEPLARFYGISNVTGDEFRKVPLDGTERSGVLTQGSILTVSSYPNRTSPVQRGKWVLENFLNAPPPPPPPNVGVLDEAAAGNTGTMRQQLEKHRANPTCAGCHSKMDPLGFGLENYDAIGAWRTTEGKFPIDTSGTLPSGKSFTSPAELKAILRSDPDAFARCMAEKILTYALGRGLERFDRKAVDSIEANVAKSGYRFSSLVTSVAKSMPFQMRRAEARPGMPVVSTASVHAAAVPEKRSEGVK